MKRRVLLFEVRFRRLFLHFCLDTSFVFDRYWQHDSGDSALIALLSVYKIISPHMVDEPFPARPKVS